MIYCLEKQKQKIFDTNNNSLFVSMTDARRQGYMTIYNDNNEILKGPFNVIIIRIFLMNILMRIYIYMEMVQLNVRKY
jgi:hypothetical protein